MQIILLVETRVGKVIEQMTDKILSFKVSYVADVVSAYVSKNSLPPGELPAFIASIYAAFENLSRRAPVTGEAAKQRPAVPINKSITPDHIISLEDGRKFQSLKRYLRTSHDMSPEEYRAKWGLPASYPMVAPNYAAKRSELAKSIGLGSMRKEALNADAALKKRGRPAKGE